MADRPDVEALIRWAQDGHTDMVGDKPWTHDPFFLHGLYHASGPVVPHPHLSLEHRDGCLTALSNQFDGLVIFLVHLHLLYLLLFIHCNLFQYRRIILRFHLLP